MFARASKKDKGVILDRLVVEIGWSRANARRQLANALKRRGPAAAVQRKPRPRTYTFDALKVLQRVWLAAGQPCGKYLAPAMAATLANMEAHAGQGAFGPVRGRYGPAVREELLRMSPATIDRLLAPHKARLHPDGKSTTRSTRNQYREAIPIMTRIPAIDRQPGLVAIDTVAHCGHTIKGQYAFTLTVTDPFTGWTVNRAVKNKAAKWIAEALDEIAAHNGSEFFTHDVVNWAAAGGSSSPARARTRRTTRQRLAHSLWW